MVAAAGGATADEEAGTSVMEGTELEVSVDDVVEEDSDTAVTVASGIDSPHGLYMKHIVLTFLVMHVIARISTILALPSNGGLGRTMAQGRQ